MRLILITTLSLFVLGSFNNYQEQLVFHSKSVSITPRTNVPDEKLEHNFTFKNQGKTSVIIQEVRPSCTCTTSGYTQKRVLPGENGYIKLMTTASQLKKAGKVEAVVKTVDDADAKSYYLLTLRYEK